MTVAWHELETCGLAAGLCAVGLTDAEPFAAGEVVEAGRFREGQGAGAEAVEDGAVVAVSVCGSVAGTSRPRAGGGGLSTGTSPPDRPTLLDAVQPVMECVR